MPTITPAYAMPSPIAGALAIALIIVISASTAPAELTVASLLAALIGWIVGRADGSRGTR